MIRRLLRKLQGPKARVVKVIVDGENLFHSLRELKRVSPDSSGRNGRLLDWFSGAGKKYSLPSSPSNYGTV